MANIFTKRIWQPYICQPNELKWEIKKKTGGPWPTQTPLTIATGYCVSCLCEVSGIQYKYWQLFYQYGFYCKTTENLKKYCERCQSKWQRDNKTDAAPVKDGNIKQHILL